MTGDGIGLWNAALDYSAIWGNRVGPTPRRGAHSSGIRRIGPAKQAELDFYKIRSGKIGI
jgi:hypothetical protein